MDYVEEHLNEVFWYNSLHSEDTRTKDVINNLYEMSREDKNLL